MITYNKLAEQVIVSYSGGDKSRDSELEVEDIILLIRQAISELVKMQIYADTKLEDGLDSSFHYIYNQKNIEVVYDSANCECYSIIPLVPMSLPGNRGLKAVMANKNNAKSFIPVRAGTIGMVADIIEENDVVYWPRGNKVIFHKNIRSKHDKVSMDIIVPAPDNLDADAEFFLPDDIQASVIQRTKELMQPIAPSDKLNNSNKDI